MGLIFFMQTNDFDKYVRQRSNQLGLSMTYVAKHSGMSRPNLYRLLSGYAENTRISTFVKLANTLQIHPIVLIQQIFEQNKFTAYSNALPVQLNDASGFIRDVSIPDNTVVKVNQRFTKTWEIQNTGQVPWQSRFLICVDHQLEVSSRSSDFAPPREQRYLQPTVNKVAIVDLAPGENTEISVEFTAPSLPGSCISYWKISDNEGNLLFPHLEGLSCLVQVLYI